MKNECVFDMFEFNGSVLGSYVISTTQVEKIENDNDVSFFHTSGVDTKAQKKLDRVDTILFTNLPAVVEQIMDDEAEFVDLDTCDYALARNDEPSLNERECHDYNGGEVMNQGQIQYLTDAVVNDLDVDESLLELTREAMTKNQLLPIIKEEIKTTIQSRRLAEGHKELTVPKFIPKPESLSIDDRLKRIDRRQRNKAAAAKCRLKKKITLENLEVESQKLQSIQQSLQREIEELQTEKVSLTQLLETHFCSMR